MAESDGNKGRMDGAMNGAHVTQMWLLSEYKTSQCWRYKQATGNVPRPSIPPPSMPDGPPSQTHHIIKDDSEQSSLGAELKQHKHVNVSSKWLIKTHKEEWAPETSHSTQAMQHDGCTRWFGVWMKEKGGRQGKMDEVMTYKKEWKTHSSILHSRFAYIHITRNNVVRGKAHEWGAWLKLLVQAYWY